MTEVKLSCGYRRYSTQVTWTSAFGKKIRVGWSTPFDVVELLDHLVLNRGEPKSRHPGSSQRQPILLVGWGPPCFLSNFKSKLKRFLKISRQSLTDVRNHARSSRVDDRRRGRSSILNRSGRRGDLDSSPIAHGLRREPQGNAGALSNVISDTIVRITSISSKSRASPVIRLYPR